VPSRTTPTTKRGSAGPRWLRSARAGAVRARDVPGRVVGGTAPVVRAGGGPPAAATPATDARARRRRCRRPGLCHVASGLWIQLRCRLLLRLRRRLPVLPDWGTAEQRPVREVQGRRGYLLGPDVNRPESPERWRDPREGGARKRILEGSGRKGRPADSFRHRLKERLREPQYRLVSAVASDPGDQGLHTARGPYTLVGGGWRPGRASRRDERWYAGEPA
jgi:hypothetical protein